MQVRCIPTTYGPVAHETLALTITEAKAGDPLEPVTVVVAKNPIAVAARRALGRRGGAAAVTFVNPHRLAELLGSVRVATGGRRPVSTPVIAGAVRAVLRDAPGRFAGVETHPATERSLVGVYRTLSELSAEDRDRLRSADEHVSDVLWIHDQIQARLRDSFSNEQDLLNAAVTELDDGAPITDQLGAVIVFLPQRLSASNARLLRAVGEHHGLTVIAGITGVAAADAAVREATEAVGGTWPSIEPPRQPIADRALSVSDADDEVRHALRAVVDAARDGIVLDRTAILYGTREPYARLVADALEAAGIEWFGESVDTAEATMLGRSVCAMLELPLRDFSRRAVMGWLGGSPVRDADNRQVPAAAWERVSRAAGVVAGPKQWHQRLSQLIEDLEADAVRHVADTGQTSRAERQRRQAVHAAELRDFIAGLEKELKAGDNLTSWSKLASWCESLVKSYLGNRSGWPPHELAGARRVEAAIDRLRDLDGIDLAPSTTAFRRALVIQLEAGLGRHGTFGRGVFVGSLPAGIGLEFDRVIIVGMAEGSIPPKHHEDPLLPDRVRAVIPKELPLKGAAIHDLHRGLLAVMAAASHVTFTFPRGDLRRNAERVPSRWLLDSIEARGEGRPAPEHLNSATGDWLKEVPSFIAGMRQEGFPAHVQEYDVRAMLDHAEMGGDPTRHPLLETRKEVHRGVELLEGRLSDRFTRFDGNVGALGERVSTIPGQVVSPTMLEAWAACPHAYFVRYVLGVAGVEDPAEQDRMGALERGSLIHRSLERWIVSAIADAEAAEGSEFDAGVTELLDLAEQEADIIAQRGQIGRDLYSARDRQRILADLEGFARFDGRRREATSTRPIACELTFGLMRSPNPAVEICLPDGRMFRLCGAIDRIDERDDGGLSIIDYKSGSARRYRNINASNPAPGGRCLQLVLYAHAARSLLGRSDAPARGDYLFVSETERNRVIGYEVSAEIDRRVLGIVGRILDGIEAGIFPQHPAAPQYRPWVECVYCEPDGLGLSHQYADWLRLRSSTDLEAYFEVSGAGVD